MMGLEDRGYLKFIKIKNFTYTPLLYLGSTRVIQNPGCLLVAINEGFIETRIPKKLKKPQYNHGPCMPWYANLALVDRHI